MTDERRTLTVAEAARALGIGRALAYRLARQGKIPVLYFGKRMVIPIPALMRFLETAGGQAYENDERIKVYPFPGHRS